MKLLKSIPAVAIVLTAFTTFEAKASDNYPDGWTKKSACSYSGKRYYKLQKTDTPASYGVYTAHRWVVENVSENCATAAKNYECGNGTSTQVNQYCSQFSD
tara:strand:+ start:813 stop:1115 length:303 start_codon:yes stop_codon:yes gene_type:complete